MTTHKNSRNAVQPHIYEAPPLILSRTADGRYIPVIEPWDPTRETANEAFTRALVITDMAIRARKEREAAAQRQEAPMHRDDLARASTADGQQSPEGSAE